jgi:heat shock protein HtpX
MTAMPSRTDAPPVPSVPSLRRRALLAVALTIAFYLLAIGVGLGLVVAPIALWSATGHGNLWLALAMIGAGLAVLRAIVPERDRFTPPGPELTRSAQPRLHEVLDDVAHRVGEPPADVVHLDLEVNASVLEHGRRRIMVLGLPLLAIVDVDELRAVVGHEYGHYVGGDTRFSRWIWRTRVAALTTVARLRDSDSWFRRSVVRWPFDGYARLFLRITNALSRRAEFAADAVSARVASPDAAGRVLRRLEAVAPAFDGFWSSDVAPMLSSERRPPIAAGFATMAAHEELASALDDVVRSDLEGREPDPYASHPTLRQRLEALGVAVEAQAPEPVATPATTLLDDVPGLERQLLAARFGDEVGAFRPANWDESAAVHLDGMEGTVERYGAVFGDALTLGEAGEAATALPARRAALIDRLDAEDRDASDEALDDLLVSVLACLVTTAARRAGATITAPPGEPVRIQGPADAALDAFDALGAIATGDVAPTTWAEHVVVRSLSAIPLAPERSGAPA